MVFVIKFVYLFVCVFFIKFALTEYNVGKNSCYLLSAVIVGLSTLYLFYTFLCDLINI